MTAWDDLELTSEHVELLQGQAIVPEALEDSGVMSVLDAEDLPDGVPSYWSDMLPALLYPWRFDGREAWQIAPDDRDRFKKYYFVDDSKTFINEVYDSGDDSGPVLIVEGSKQQFAAFSAALDGLRVDGEGDAVEWSVYGIAGCWNWTSANLSCFKGRRVVVIFDGDIATNLDVYRGAELLRDNLVLYGAGDVSFVMLPTTGTSGLDDWLALADEGARTEILERLIKTAGPLPKKKPKAKAKPANAFIDNRRGGLLVESLAQDILAKHPAALAANRQVSVYQNGVYRIDDKALTATVTDRLGEQYRVGHKTNTESFIGAVLYREGRFLPDHVEAPMLNCANGMLNLLTGELTEHDPSWMSTTQIPIDWRPEAVCPTYEAWLSQTIPEQADDLEEAISTMLDPSKTPTKAAFLFGPSRSGKSTFVRLAEAMAGMSNVSGVTLHQLTTNRFMAASVFGKMLNAAADISAAHIDDLAIFKQMTGEDLVQAEDKGAKPFSFVNRTLFVFSANELPTVSEGSKAYVERIKPFHFWRSFAGSEDPNIESAMRTELEGILVRWVKAYQRLSERGSYLPTDPRVKHLFEINSDRVRQWFEDEMVAIWEGDETSSKAPQGSFPRHLMMTKTELTAVFKAWAQKGGYQGLGSHRIAQRLGNIPGVLDVTSREGRIRGFNVIPKEVWGDLSSFGATLPPSENTKNVSYTLFSHIVTDSPPLTQGRKSVSNSWENRVETAQVAPSARKGSDIVTGQPSRTTSVTDINHRNQQLGRSGRFIEEVS